MIEYCTAMADYPRAAQGTGDVFLRAARGLGERPAEREPGGDG